MTTAETRTRSRFHDGILLLSVLSGPSAWFVHLGVSYILVTLPCIRVTGSTRDYLYVVTAITASIALAGTILGLAFYRRYYGRQGAAPAESGGRGGFMAALGLMLSGVSFLAILVQSAALPFAEFCE